MIRVFLLGYLFSILALCLAPSLIHAQTYTEGYKLYTKGDFKSAVEVFERTLLRKEKISTEDKSRIFKYLGICHYMLKKKANARQFFRAALTEDPNIKIDPEEVLDANIVKYFERIRKRLASRGSARAAPSKSSTGQQSFMIIKTGRVKADVLIDGKIVGETNAKIPVEPGLQKVELRTASNRKKTLRLPIKAGRTNVFDLLSSNRKRKTKSRKKQRIVLPADQISDEDLATAKPPAKKEDKKVVEKKRAPIPVPLPSSGSEEAPEKEAAASQQEEPDDQQSEASGSFSALHLLPFGIGQFANGDSINGSLFAVSELAMIALYAQSYVEEEKFFQQASDRIIEERESGATDPELEAYRSESEEYIAKLQQAQVLYMSAFGALWLGGVIHAIVTAPAEAEEPQSALYFSPHVNGLQLTAKHRSHQLEFQWKGEQELALSYRLEF